MLGCFVSRTARSTRRHGHPRARKAFQQRENNGRRAHRHRRSRAGRDDQARVREGCGQVSPDGGELN